MTKCVAIVYAAWTYLITRTGPASKIPLNGIWRNLYYSKLINHTYAYFPNYIDIRNDTRE